MVGSYKFCFVIVNSLTFFASLTDTIFDQLEDLHSLQMLKFLNCILDLLNVKGTYRDHRVTGALNFHKTRDFGILVMVLDV